MPKLSFKQKLRQLFHPFYRRLETTVHPLRYLFLEITQRCNLHCLHCGSDCSKTPRPGELSTEEWLNFIDYLGNAYRKKSELLLVITGGEPLCHPDLDQLLHRVKKNGLNYGIVTNGYLLSEKNLKMLQEREIHSITVSLDGLASSHDWLRGLQGSFARAYHGIKLLAQASIPFFDIVTCVNPRNLDELPAILQLLQKAGVTRWRLFNIFPKGRAAINSELILSEVQVRNMFQWIKKTRSELEGTGFTLDFACEGYLPKELDSQVRNEPYFCRAGISIGSVLCDGAISACPNISMELVQGNIRTDDFATIWENKFEHYRDRTWMKTGQCAECNEWGRCQGNSLHLWDAQKQQTIRCYHAIMKDA